uniref:Uncharacterized protein n=1 Tax=Glossina palpalis gambiensis TaxID=67801 RepID=A0A1B0B4Y3_9MUSC
HKHNPSGEEFSVVSHFGFIVGYGPALLPSVPTCCCSSTVLVATNLRRSDRALLALMLIDQ